ncbi:hypothetical protein FLP10_15145 [Agromyces intestinalis]|uniref:Uncharacterized protein n=2 Tax=Agromyces intestinalis TaxID=2592652 RepID=A0A5C1YJA4_9MICO|nr:hypothetical protein FLP10_15145 [Agromyces intestinalis]
MNYAIKGANVCRLHGGSAPQVRAAAQIRLLMASDNLMASLLKIADDESIPVQVRLAAIRDGLDRANIVGTQQVAIELGVKPDWEQRLLEAGVVRRVEIDWDDVGEEVIDAEVVESPEEHTAQLKASAYAAETGPRSAVRPLKPRRAPKQPEADAEPDFYDPSPLASRTRRGPKP